MSPTRRVVARGARGGDLERAVGKYRVEVTTGRNRGAGRAGGGGDVRGRGRADVSVTLEYETSIPSFRGRYPPVSRVEQREIGGFTACARAIGSGAHRGGERVVFRGHQGDVEPGTQWYSVSSLVRKQ